MRKVLGLVGLMIAGSLTAQSSQFVENKLLNEGFKNYVNFVSNSNLSSDFKTVKKVFIKDEVTYEDHLFEAASFQIPLIHDYNQMDELVAEHKLMNVPEEGEGYIIQKLTHSRAVLIERAFDILNEISNKFHAETSKKISVSSLTRTLESQKKLGKVNSNAIKGESAHAYGASFDISYAQYSNVRGRNYQYEKQLQSILDEMVAEGKIYYIKERRQPCFHVTVRNPDLIYPEELMELMNHQHS